MRICWKARCWTESMCLPVDMYSFHRKSFLWKIFVIPWFAGNRSSTLLGHSSSKEQKGEEWVHICHRSIVSLLLQVLGKYTANRLTRLIWHLRCIHISFTQKWRPEKLAILLPIAILLDPTENHTPLYLQGDVCPSHNSSPSTDCAIQIVVYE